MRSTPPRPLPLRLADWILVATLSLVAAGAILFAVMRPAPPRTIVMASGPPGGAYHDIALRYADALRRVGIRLDLVETSGAVENLELITARPPRVDIGLIQGGLIQPGTAPTLYSIGLIAYEPVWIFHQNRQPLQTLTDLKGKRIAIGSPKSGTNALARMLLELHGVGSENSQFVERNFEDASRALAENSVEAMVIVAAATSPVVAQLLKDPAIKLFGFERAHGYARHFNFLHPLTLHKGAVDLRRNLPDRDVPLVATSARIAVRDTLHPAVVYLLAEIASEIHRSNGLFETAGEFPKALDPELPTADAAERYYRHGAPFLHSKLPFWIADFIERIWLLVTPIAAIGLALFKLVPMTYRWFIERRVIDWYVRLQKIEDQLAHASEPASIDALWSALDQIEQEVLASHASILKQRIFEIREHIEFVRKRIRAFKS